VKEDKRNPTRVVGTLCGKSKSMCGFFRRQPACNGMSTKKTVETLLKVVGTFYFANETRIFLNSVFAARKRTSTSALTSHTSVGTTKKG